MASYYGNYQNELGKIFEKIQFSVYLIDITTGTRGTREISSEKEDKKYIPSVFFNHATLVDSNSAYCKAIYPLRYALLWINKEQYLKVELPFLPGSNEYVEFLNEAKTKVSTLGISGENISDQFLRLYYARNP